jgi:hypothetical protein
VVDSTGEVLAVAVSTGVTITLAVITATGEVLSPTLAVGVVASDVIIGETYMERTYSSAFRELVYADVYKDG